jgi:hypothetical protein
MSTRPAVRHVALIALLVNSLLVVDARVAHSQQLIIDTAAIRGHTFFLSHDLLEGRGTGTPAADLAAIYIESACKALGLRPLGDSFIQTVPLERGRVLAETQLRIENGTQLLEFRYPEVGPALGVQASQADFRGPAVYVGPSDQIPTPVPGEVDLTGKVAFTLGVLQRGASYALAQRGAVGVVQLIPDAAEFRQISHRRDTRWLYHRDSTIRSSYWAPVPSIVAGPTATRAISRAVRASVGASPPVPLNFHVAFRLAAERHSILAKNVLCLLEGRPGSAADSLIVLAAHYDHLGIGPPDADGDSIYNGFSDNAAGVAVLLAVARAFRQTPAAALRHSVLFAFFGGEEMGLLGSDFYVANAPWTLGRTLAAITVDAGAPPAPPTSWELAGVDSTGLGSLAIRVAAARGWDVITSQPRPISDFYPFVRRGVSGMLIIPGSGPYEGLSVDSSLVLRKRWDRYHQPSDEWSPDFPFGGLRRYAEYVGLITLEMDQRGLERRDD